MARWTVQDLLKTEWFGPLVEKVREELAQMLTRHIDSRPALESEHRQLQQQIQGWSQSLAKTNLSTAVRAVIENDLDAALRRQQEIDRQLSETGSRQEQLQSAVDPQQVVDKLQRLAEVLGSNTPSRTNLELSLHIEAIRCYQGGRVVVRTCKLGALAGAGDLLARPEGSAPASPKVTGRGMVAKPRRRAVRRLDDDSADRAELRAAAHTAADVHRFAGLGEEWFWEDELQVVRTPSWARSNAAEVARLRARRMTIDQLAAHFGKSPPTIYQALKLAAEADPSVRDLPRKITRDVYVEHASEVAKLKAEGMSLLAIARKLGICEPTVRKALSHAQRAPASPPPQVSEAAAADQEEGEGPAAPST